MTTKDETNKVLQEAIEIAAKTAAVAIRETEHPRAGILGLAIAAVTLAELVGWDREKIDEAWQAAVNDAYNKPTTRVLKC